MDYQTPERMAAKRRIIPVPDLTGKTVLDVGCDHGWWCWFAADMGARYVLGLDRNRNVGKVHKDLISACRLIATERQLPCEFKRINVGREWHTYGRFDVVFLFSLYHHIFENCADHNAIWFWLHQHTRDVLLWENPTGPEDSVVKLNVTHHYDRMEIIEAARLFFDVEEIGVHNRTRYVWRCRPHARKPQSWKAQMRQGSGGATPAFNYAGGRRMDEIENITGIRPVPGSLNIHVSRPFDWDGNYFRSRVLDVAQRGMGLDGPWFPRWARFYPLMANDVPVFAFRFEGETYKDTAVELIAGIQLREVLPEEFTLRCPN